MVFLQTLMQPLIFVFFQYNDIKQQIGLSSNKQKLLLRAHYGKKASYELCKCLFGHGKEVSAVCCEACQVEHAVFKPGKLSAVPGVWCHLAGQVVGGGLGSIRD